MHGFGSHAYSFLNAANERIWVKFHFRTKQGIQNLTDAEARLSSARIAKPTSAICSKISRPQFPTLDPIHPGDDGRPGEGFPLQPFDLTKVWPKVISADRGRIFRAQPESENVFAEVE